jgi:hypothetical protein
MAAAPKEHNEVAALENWRILIKKEEASPAPGGNAHFSAV